MKGNEILGEYQKLEAEGKLIVSSTPKGRALSSDNYQYQNNTNSPPRHQYSEDEDDQSESIALYQEDDSASMAHLNIIKKIATEMGSSDQGGPKYSFVQANSTQASIITASK
jgi:hypothetical protein